MPKESGYLVATVEGSAYVRAFGLANMNNAPMLDAFLNSEIELGLHTVCIDLSECTGMDSTFMGTLVGFHHRMSSDGGRFLVVNPTASNNKLLDMLGVSQVIPVLHEHVAPELTFYRLEMCNAQTPQERAELMKRAHLALVDLSAENAKKFAPFLAALENDLKKK